MELQNIAVIGQDQRIAGDEEERLFESVSQKTQSATGSQRFVLICPVYLVFLFDLLEVRFDQFLLVVDDDMKILTSGSLISAHDVLDDRQIPDRDQRFGQDLGEGIEPRSLAARIDNDGDRDLLSLRLV